MICMFGTGDPAIDQVLLDLAMHQHPLEKEFPIGCKVLIKMDIASLGEKIKADFQIRPRAAMGIAWSLKSTPVEVVGITDLTDEDGIDKPFISVMDPDGYIYSFLAEDLGRV